MIELFLKRIIDNLGATGLLVVGLYFLLYRPLTSMSTHLHHINHELEKIIQLLDTAISTNKK